MKNPCPSCRKQKQCKGKCSKKGKYDDECDSFDDSLNYRGFKNTYRKPNKI